MELVKGGMIVRHGTEYRALPKGGLYPLADFPTSRQAREYLASCDAPLYARLTRDWFQGQ